MKHFRFSERILKRMNEEVTYFIVRQNDVVQPTCRNCGRYTNASKSTVHIDLSDRFKYFVDFFPYLFSNNSLSKNDSEININGLNKSDIIKFIELNKHLLRKSISTGPLRLQNIYMLTEANYKTVQHIMMMNKEECTLRGGQATRNKYQKRIKEIKNSGISQIIYDRNGGGLDEN